jgi:hypothetical protein
MFCAFSCPGFLSTFPLRAERALRVSFVLAPRLFWRVWPLMFRDCELSFRASLDNTLAPVAARICIAPLVAAARRLEIARPAAGTTKEIVDTVGTGSRIESN